MATESSLPDILLTDTPTAFAVDESGIYISFGRRTSRFTLNGTGEMHLRNTVSDVRDMIVVGNYLYLMFASNVMSVDKANGALIENKDFFYTLRGVSASTLESKIFGRSQGVSPSDILQLALNPDGTMGNLNDSQYHGDYPGASQTYVTPDEQRVIDNSGIVYATTDITYAGSLAGGFDDLDFYGDVPIVLRTDTLYAYSQALLETGSYGLGQPGGAVAVDGDKVFVFSTGTLNELLVEIVSVDLLTPEPPGQAIDPTRVPYVPDEITIDESRQTVYLFDKELQSVFRWSLASRDYGQTIPLSGSPSHMTHSAPGDRLYLAYASGKITKIELQVDDSEAPFVNSPQTPLGLATAGEYLFVVDPSGAWVSHFTYHPDGSLISQEEWNYFSQEYVWNAANQKMYFFRDDTSPNDLLWENIDANGVIGTKQDSPFHSSAGILHPIRVAPDGSLVILGSGVVYDAISLDQVDSLANNVDDITWRNGKTYSIRALGGSSQIQVWGTNYGIDESIAVAGTPVMLQSVGADFLIVTLVDGAPRLIVWDPDTPRIDADVDGLLDGMDNCMQLGNADQTDSDNDGIGNACDPDLNNDNVVDFGDLPIMQQAFFSQDGDLNWNPDADMNGDGVVDFADLPIMQSLFFGPPGPSGLAP